MSYGKFHQKQKNVSVILCHMESYNLQELILITIYIFLFNFSKILYNKKFFVNSQKILFNKIPVNGNQPTDQAQTAIKSLCHD